MVFMLVSLLSLFYYNSPGAGVFVSAANETTCASLTPGAGVFVSAANETTCALLPKSDDCKCEAQVVPLRGNTCASFTSPGAGVFVSAANETTCALLPKSHDCKCEAQVVPLRGNTCASLTASVVLRSRTAMLMGSRFDISIVAKDSLTAEHEIDSVISEVSRIENLISDWRAQTQISEVNRNAGIAPVKVDKEVLELTRRAIEFSKITGGAFDISFAAMERIWKFDGSMTEMPSREAVKKAVAKVGYRNIIIDTLASTIFLKLSGMKIGFGALGEGYAADQCKKIMLAKGIEAGIVNGSGDMNTWGKNPNGSAWKIGIADPFQRGDLYAIVPIEKGAVTTSGSYEKFAEINGKRYAHIINPATGYPASGLISVTVFGESAETCNALSTSIMVLQAKKGLKLLKKFPGYSCIMVTDKGKFISSPGFDWQKYRINNNL